MEERHALTGCDLAGSKYCHMLNMGSCESCPAFQEDETEKIRKNLDAFEALMPEGGIARLFLEETCQFCKRERRHGYALLDMAHPEPKKVRKKREDFLKRQNRYGVMIPLQFGICDHCRRKFLMAEYLPMALPVLVGGLGLVLLYSIGEGSRGLDGPWAFLCLVALTLAALFGGKAISRVLRKKMEGFMMTDVMTHPVVQEMIALGWIPVLGQNKNQLLFSKTRISRGLGTAIPWKESEKIH